MLTHVGVVAYEILEQVLVSFVCGVMRQRIAHAVDAFVDVDHLALLLDKVYNALLVAEHNQRHEVGLINHNSVAHASNYIIMESHSCC